MTRKDYGGIMRKTKEATALNSSRTSKGSRSRKQSKRARRLLASRFQAHRSMDRTRAQLRRHLLKMGRRPGVTISNLLMIALLAKSLEPTTTRTKRAA